MGVGGSEIVGSVSSTSPIRPADTAARGTMTNMITAIMIANRIWVMYWMNAVRLPIGISPLSTRNAPSHRTATVDRFMISISTGMVIANRRLTRRPTSIRSRLASSNRRSSCSVRTNARMTRTPESVSRITRLMRSILSCIAWNSGMARFITMAMNTAMTGRITSRIAVSGPSWR